MPKDPIRQKENQAKHYLKNKGKYAASSKKARAKRINTIQKLKASGCKYCGEKHIACLDFHHPNDDKLFTIASRMHLVSVKTLIEEASKCEVVCTNCHRKIHWKEIHPENPDGLISECV